MLRKAKDLINRFGQRPSSVAKLVYVDSRTEQSFLQLKQMRSDGGQNYLSKIAKLGKNRQERWVQAKVKQEARIERFRAISTRLSTGKHT